MTFRVLVDANKATRAVVKRRRGLDDAYDVRCHDVDATGDRGGLGLQDHHH